MTIRLSKNGKRMGRPPKKSSGVVFISASPPIKEESAVVDAESMMECEFLHIPKYSHMPSTDLKQGRYMTSVYTIDGFGRNKWVVGAYLMIDGDINDDVIKRCVNYLNSITVNKKGKKKYGNLQLHRFNKIKRNGKELVCIEIITDERNNENFWGEGERL